MKLTQQRLACGLYCQHAFHPKVHSLHMVGFCAAVSMPTIWFCYIDGCAEQVMVINSSLKTSKNNGFVQLVLNCVFCPLKGVSFLFCTELHIQREELFPTRGIVFKKGTIF